jgi:hypothetical protein
MKIKTFINYLKENIREDEFSHLNDRLSANNEDRDYDYDDDSTKSYGEYDDFYDDYDHSYEDEDDDYDYDDNYNTEDEDDDINHLTYLLRQMFKNSGIDKVEITAKRNEDIVIECYMGQKDSLRNIIKAFEVANKLKRDILAQYDSRFEIWQTRKGAGILSFGFTLGDGLDDDNAPF